MNTEIIIALISFASSILGGLLVAIVNHFLTRRRTEAEIEKLKADTQKSLAEAKKTLAEAEKISNDAKHVISEASYNESPALQEKVIYDGRKGINEYDITIQDSVYDIQKGVIVIQGTQYWDKIELRQYMYDGEEYPYIPKDVTVSGLRRIYVRCEMKVIGASYDVGAFLWETPEVDDDRDHSIDERTVHVIDSEWRETPFYFRVPPEKNYTVNLHIERISGEGSLQIRNLVVTERVS